MLLRLIQIGLFAAVIACVGCSSNSPAPAQQASAQTSSPASSVPAATVPGSDVPNPTHLDAVSIAQGKELYHKADCALCHGKEGDGRGFLAKDTRMNVHDWRDASYSKTFTDGQLFTVIVKGKDKMPAYETRNTTGQVWLMVDYIRSLSAR
jgi:mono/diheme cytochrome c family protein